MKTKHIFFIVLLCVSSHCMADGIKFYHGTWQQVLQEAKRQNKPIFVDFYATWCGPCVRMSNEVFTQQQVGDFFNQNIISYKIDAEKDELELVESIGLEAYPTLIFFNAEGKVIKKHVGYIEHEPLVELARLVKSYGTLKQAVLQGTADRASQISYLTMAKDADPETFKRMAPGVVSTFSVEELQLPEPWALFVETVSEITSPAFNKALEHAQALSEAHDGYIDFMYGVLDNYMMAQVQRNNEGGLSLYAKNMERFYNALAETKRPTEFFALMAKKEFYRMREDTVQYLPLLIKYIDSYYMDDWSILGDNAMELAARSQVKAHQEKALAWAQAAVKLDRNINSVYSLAVVYESIHRKSDAIKTATELLKFDLSEENLEFVNAYIKRLKG